MRWPAATWMLGIVLLAAASGMAEATEAPVCAGIRARWESTRADLQVPQVSALLFAAADNGCPALGEDLLAAGALIEAKDRFGTTPLGHAAREGQLDVIAMLLAHGADINHGNLAGSSPLFLAIERHHPDAAAYLIAHGADVNEPGRSHVTPLAVAAFSGDDATVALLLAKGVKTDAYDVTGKTAMVYVAGGGHAAIVKRLLAAKQDVNERYGNDLTALMWAAGYVDGVADAAGEATVATLLDAGAQVNAEDNRGRTALMIAAERGHADIVKLLLARGADPKHTDRQGKTARDLAANETVKAALPPPG